MKAQELLKKIGSKIQKMDETATKQLEQLWSSLVDQEEKQLSKLTKKELIEIVQEQDKQIEQLQERAVDSITAAPKLKAERIAPSKNTPFEGSVLFEVPYKNRKLVFMVHKHKNGGFTGIKRIHIEDKGALTQELYSVWNNSAPRSWKDSEIAQSFNWTNSAANKH